MSSAKGDCILLEEEDEEAHPKQKTTFHVSENAYETVEFTPRSTHGEIVIRKDGNKKCLVVMCFILLFTLVLSISIAIAFPLEIIKLTAEIDELEAMLTGDVLGQCESFPVLSCTTLPPSLPSGYYWVLSLNGTAMRVFCEMERSCGGITGGWTRVVKLDMANSSHQCPGDLRQRTDSNIRTCVNSAHSPGCSSTTFDVEHGQYSMICGRVIAYQFGTTDAFGGNRGHSIDSNYVDGVSLTHGSPRSHIWTFAAALDEQAHYHVNASSYCPCINSAEVVRHILTPVFVNHDYFCDTGGQYIYQERILYSANSLWDGVGCGRKSSCCSFNSPPWFYKDLSEDTTDDIEMRVCRDEDSSNEDIAIEMVEIYVQ